MQPTSVLELQGYGLAYGSTVVLAEVDCQVAARGVTVLFGPAGTGKSSLLRSVAGLLDNQPSIKTWGTATYLGAPLGNRGRPHLVGQNMRHFVSTVFRNLGDALACSTQLTLEAKRARVIELLRWAELPELEPELDAEAASLPSALLQLMPVLRAIATNAPLICVDEATVRAAPQTTDRLLRLLRAYAAEHAVLFVTHHQAQARTIADRCVLLAGGRVLESSEATLFFESTNPLTRHFLDTGGLAIPSPTAKIESLSEEVTPPPPLPRHAVDVMKQAWSGPSQFRWLVPGKVGGCPRPGIIVSLDDDLAALMRVGVNVLVSLEETSTVPAESGARFGIEVIHFPIVDMRAPTCEAAFSLCTHVAQRLKTSDCIAMHCRAGQGRTGTMLAALRIVQGQSAVDALDEVRGVNPKWVTSEEQVRFLGEFFDFVRSTHTIN